MCRLFGFRSVIQSQVHRSLVAANNALAIQSQRHPDGWGVAYYVANAPHIIKGASAAYEDHIFQRVSGSVASETVLAHLRKATTGEINILNSHPFQHGQWVFAHNGQIHDFDRSRAPIVDQIAPALRRYILGDTDSETLFYLFLTYLARATDLHRHGTPINTVVEALVNAVTTTRELADGPLDDQRSKLTVLVTDGNTLVGLRSGMPLVYSTFKKSCLERGSCPFFSPECEAPTTSGRVNHLIVSSERLQGDNEWIDLQDGEVVGVDWGMNLYRGAFHGRETYLSSP